MRLMNKLRLFMQGRNGVDALTGTLLVFYFILGIIRIFIRNHYAVLAVSLIMAGVLCYILFRVLSKNIASRQRENLVVLRFFDKVKPHLILFKDRIKDIKTKRYRRCPCCKNVLRLPYKKGKHNVRCPKCGNNFTVHII